MFPFQFHLHKNFQDDIDHYPYLKPGIEDFVRRIIENPYYYTHPLKKIRRKDHRGMRFAWFRGKKYVIGLIICEECRRLRKQRLRLCEPKICEQRPDNCIIFHSFGAHDPAYRKMKF